MELELHSGMLDPSSSSSPAFSKSLRARAGGAAVASGAGAREAGGAGEAGGRAHQHAGLLSESEESRSKTKTPKVKSITVHTCSVVGVRGKSVYFYTLLYLVYVHNYSCVSRPMLYEVR